MKNLWGILDNNDFARLTLENQKGHNLFIQHWNSTSWLSMVTVFTQECEEWKLINLYCSYRERSVFNMCSLIFGLCRHWCGKCNGDMWTPVLYLQISYAHKHISNVSHNNQSCSSRYWYSRIVCNIRPILWMENLWCFIHKHVWYAHNLLNMNNYNCTMNAKS